METKEFETKVIDIIQRTHDIKSFRFAVSEDINFKPGQFFVVTIKINNKEASKHFSFSNSPTEKGMPFILHLLFHNPQQNISAWRAGVEGSELWVVKFYISFLI